MQFTFGPFTFDGTTARLSRDNAEVRLRAQALQVLRVLLQHGGRPIGSPDDRGGVARHVCLTTYR